MWGDDDTGEEDHQAARERLVDQLEARGRVTDPTTLAALRAVPRHEFVPEHRREGAYGDHPLPIGDGQTISAPHMVGIMADRLEAEPGDRVLEIGTGCGYHAAITTEIVGDGNVYSVEYSQELAEGAREILDRLGYDVHVRVGDGHEGWPEEAPFDAAYLTCATEELPSAIAEQVRPGGRILAPVGTSHQTLYRYTKQEDGRLDRESFGGVRFVQMRGH
jgi:protein-L-isoaspartate(D-aspartate) O-methyltransferase